MRFGEDAKGMGAYHVHHHCDNLYYLLTGTMTSIIGGVRFTTRAGEAIFMPRNVPHATGNFAAGEMRALEVYTPSTWITGAHDSRPVDLPADIKPA